jgi:hypothetical protein
MQLDYQQALNLKGQMIEYKNKTGEWAIGRVVGVKKNGLEIEELKKSSLKDGFGYGFWGGPFWGPPVVVPFVGFAFNPFFLW